MTSRYISTSLTVSIILQLCVALLAAVALAAPEGKRDKRGYLSSGYLSSGWLDSDLSAHSLDHDLSSYSLDEPIISHSIISKPAIVHEPAIINQRFLLRRGKTSCVTSSMILEWSLIKEQP